METSFFKAKDFTIEYFNIDQLGDFINKNNGEWEPHILLFTQMYSELFAIENIIDVGANFGYHTLFFSQHTKGNVYAFEPQKQNFRLLKQNIINNNVKNAVLFNLACGDIETEIKIPLVTGYFNEIKYEINMGDFTPNVIGNNNIYSVVKSVILDNFSFPKIDLIKIDVQGWEKKVLLGSLNLLQKDKPILIVEFEGYHLQKLNVSCVELFTFLRENNYYIFFLEYDYPCDHVCVHNDHLLEFKYKFKNYIFSHTENNKLNNNVINGITEKLSFVSIDPVEKAKYLSDLIIT
jgi:FkbM family methyltransferase